MKHAATRPRRPRRSPSPEILEARRLLAQGVDAPFQLADDISAPADYRTAADAGGRVTVVYQAQGEEGSGYDVFGRRYDSAGNPLGGPFRLNDATAGDQVSPRVTVDDAGNMVVSWWSDSQVYFRRYDAGGAPIGGEAPLAGTQGLSPEYEVFGLQSYGFALYADGFQVRFYGADGTPGTSASFADEVAQEGWTVVESQDPARAARPGSRDGVSVTWTTTRAREEGGTTVYDAQVWTTDVNYHDGQVSAPDLVYQADGLTEDVAASLDPRFLWSDDRTLIAWREDAEGTPTIRGRSIASWGAPIDEIIDFRLESVGYVDGAATAIAMGRSGGISVYYVPTESSTPRTSYTRDGLIQGDGSWRPFIDGDPAPQFETGPLGRVSIRPTAAADFWMLWTDSAAEPDLRAVRVYSALDDISPVASTQAAVEREGSASVRLLRTGDLSTPVTFPVWSADGGTATPGYDFTPFFVEVTFAPGQAEAEVSIPLHHHAAIEGDRTMRISYVSPYGVRYDPDWTRTFEFTILDDADPAAQALTFLDYDAAGVWARDEAGGWLQISPFDPEQILAFSERSVALSFGAAGLWLWDADAGWAKLNDLAPQAMAQGAGRLFLDYGDSGLWSWARAAGWAQLNHVDPARMVADGRGLYVQFAHGGTWSWRPESGYKPISDAAPEDMVPFRGGVYLDYGADGLWRSDPAIGGRSRISDSDPARMTASEWILFVDFGAGGLWAWAEAGTPEGGVFTRLGDSPPGPFAASRTRLFAGYGEAGLSAWDATASWQQINELAPLAIHAGWGHDDVLIDYGAEGLWSWSATAGWSKANDLAPRAVSRI